MKSVPLVSVIMPTFNRRDYLGEAVDSVISQSIGNWEWLIIDDGSSEDTEEFLRSSYSDSRISYYKQQNQGQSAARNKGISHSRGNFICFLDSDNRWYPNKLVRQLDEIQNNPDVDIVYGDSYIIDGTGEIVSRRNIARYSGYITAKLLVDNFISMNTTMTRSPVIKKIGGFNTSNRWDEDYELWLSVSINSRFLYIPEYFGEYRIMGNQISDDKESRIQANEKLILQFVSRNPNVVSKKEKKLALSKFYHRWAYLARSEKRHKDATGHYLHSLSLAPLTARAYLGLLKNITLWGAGLLSN